MSDVEDLNKRLAEAIAQEDVASVRLHLAQGADPNAIAYGKKIESNFVREYISDPPVVNFIFEFPEGSNKRAVTPEMHAILLALIENGLDPHVLIREQFPIICMAAGEGFDDCVLSLIQRGADVNAEHERSGETLLDWAVNPINERKIKLETIKVIVEHGASVNPHYKINSSDPSSESDEPQQVKYCGIPPLNGLSDPELIAYLRSKGAKTLYRNKDSGNWFLI